MYTQDVRRAEFFPENSCENSCENHCLAIFVHDTEYCYTTSTLGFLIDKNLKLSMDSKISIWGKDVPLRALATILDAAMEEKLAIPAQKSYEYHSICLKGLKLRDVLREFEEAELLILVSPK